MTVDFSPYLDSPELMVIKECTPDLETALSVLERGFVHFLAQEGFKFLSVSLIHSPC